MINITEISNDCIHRFIFNIFQFYVDKKMAKKHRVSEAKTCRIPRKLPPNFFRSNDVLVADVVNQPKCR